MDNELVKIFQPTQGGGLEQLEEEINNWFEKCQKDKEFCYRILDRLQSQSGDSVTITIFYEKRPRNY